MGVVEGAAGGHEERVARDVLKTLEERGMRAMSPPWLRGAADALARDVLALVADREALLERIKVLESGSGTAACSGGES